MRGRLKALERSIQTQLQSLEAAGINDDFQAGYACALIHSWSAAGYAIPEKVWEMTYSQIVGRA